jgi:CxxC motif-containing protein
MGEARHLTCIVCPKGCSIEALIENGQIKEIKGNKCKRGAEYARMECMDPRRILTTTVRVYGGEAPLTSVKTDKPLPKGKIMDCMKCLNQVRLTAPVAVGNIVVENILDTGVNIIVTKKVDTAC